MEKPRTFYSTGHIAKKLGISITWVKDLAEKAGVEPIRSQGFHGARMYNEEELAIIESYRDSKAGKG